MKPSYKFKVVIQESKGEFWATLVARNNETVFTGETRKRKRALIKTINNLFPSVEIVDKTLK